MKFEKLEEKNIIPKSYYGGPTKRITVNWKPFVADSLYHEPCRLIITPNFELSALRQIRRFTRDLVTVYNNIKTLFARNLDEQIAEIWCLMTIIIIIIIMTIHHVGAVFMSHYFV